MPPQEGVLRPAQLGVGGASASVLYPQWLQVGGSVPMSPEPSTWHRRGPFVKEAHVYS